MSEKDAMQKLMDAIKAKRGASETLGDETKSPADKILDSSESKLTPYEQALLELKDQEG